MFAILPFVCKSQPIPSGVVNNIIAGEAIPNFSAVYLGGDGLAYVCDRNTAAAGIAIDTAAIGDTIQMLRSGVIYNWIGTDNATYYIGDDGALTATAPTWGIVQQVAKSDFNDLYINLLEPHTVDEAARVLGDDVVRSFSTELENVDGYYLDLESGATYIITGRLFFATTDAISGYRYATSFDGSGSGYYRNTYTSFGVLEAANVTGYDSIIAATDVLSGEGVSAVSFDHVLTVVEGGRYALAFAQSVLSINDVTFLTGSTLTAKRIK